GRLRKSLWTGRLNESTVQVLGPLARDVAIFSQECHMPHLSARAYLTLPIVVEERSGKLKQALTFGIPFDHFDVLPDEIDHRGRTQELHLLRGQATHRSDLLFELREAAGVKRVMPRIVRARSHLVDQYDALRQLKQFETKQADAIHPLNNGTGKRLRPC